MTTYQDGDICTTNREEKKMSERFTSMAYGCSGLVDQQLQDLFTKNTGITDPEFEIRTVGGYKEVVFHSSWGKYYRVLLDTWLNIPCVEMRKCSLFLRDSDKYKNPIYLDCVSVYNNIEWSEDNPAFSSIDAIYLSGCNRDDISVVSYLPMDDKPVSGNAYLSTRDNILLFIETMNTQMQNSAAINYSIFVNRHCRSPKHYLKYLVYHYGTMNSFCYDMWFYHDDVEFHASIDSALDFINSHEKEEDTDYMIHACSIIRDEE